MSDKKQAASIRNVVETPWQQYPGHFGGALSKPLVRPEIAGAHGLRGDAQPQDAGADLPRGPSCAGTTPVEDN